MGKALEALPITVLVFAVLYGAAKKKKALKLSAARIARSGFWTVLVTCFVYGLLHDAIQAGFGMTADAPGFWDLLAQLILAALVAQSVIITMSKPLQR